MLPEDLRQRLQAICGSRPHPREQAVEVMFALQRHYGWLTEEALGEAAGILGMTPLELDEIATFYDFIYRAPVGKYVIHVCDSVMCWMAGYETVKDHLLRVLGVKPGEVTRDGLFTVLPTCCLGYCDRAPAMLVNGRVYGHLTPEKIERILARYREEEPDVRIDR